MWNLVINALFGCSHRRTTFPLTPVHKVGNIYPPASGATRHGMYVVCLDCGKELAYDWEKMQIGEPVPVRVATATTLSPANR